jgi:hypothetical protein
MAKYCCRLKARYRAPIKLPASMPCLKSFRYPCDINWSRLVTISRPTIVRHRHDIHQGSGLDQGVFLVGIKAL